GSGLGQRHGGGLAHRFQGDHLQRQSAALDSRVQGQKCLPGGKEADPVSAARKGGRSPGAASQCDLAIAEAEIRIMRSFRVFAHSVETAEAVKVGFSWPAMLITLPWMLDKGLWTLAALWFGMESALALMIVLIPAGEERDAMAVLALLV